MAKHENYSSSRKGEREYLSNTLAGRLTRQLNGYFESKVDVPRIRHGKRQILETLIHEEALLFAKYLRNENSSWIPRIVQLSN